MIIREAKIKAGKWRSYRPIAKTNHMTQNESSDELNFEALYTLIHQINPGLEQLIFGYVIII